MDSNGDLKLVDKVVGSCNCNYEDMNKLSE